MNAVAAPRVLLASALLGVVVLSSRTGFGGGSATTMSVSATVSNNCTVNAGALSFGAYDPVSANATTPLNATSTVTLTCTNGAATTIRLNQGINPLTGSTATVPLRQLAATTNRLRYYIYQDAARTTAWGDSTAGKAFTGTGTAVAISVYGSIAAGQNVPAGSYGDTVTVTVNF